jgi:hypothetical protein
MPEMVKSSETKLFADDSLLFRTINNQADMSLFSNCDAISWMVTMSWDSHDRFLRNPC